MLQKQQRTQETEVDNETSIHCLQHIKPATVYCSGLVQIKVTLHVYQRVHPLDKVEKRQYLEIKLSVFLQDSHGLGFLSQKYTPAWMNFWAMKITSSVNNRGLKSFRVCDVSFRCLGAQQHHQLNWVQGNGDHYHDQSHGRLMFAKGWWTGWVREKTNRSKQNEGYTNHKRRRWCDDTTLLSYWLTCWIHL